MRLIDADALIEHLQEYKTVYGVPMTNRDKQMVHFMIGHIKNLEPTAYDVEAVVAELENQVKLHRRLAEDYKDYEDYCTRHLSIAESYELAISIVRGKE